ncbi:MAG: bifunctional phosphopantothenoylcysteine decarboxylase/phosphopantothenate--cysteine ligase CoaBC [Candidatus Competibacterales bacterium]
MRDRIQGVAVAMGMLAGKRILLGVSGGIAAYKACELVRRLTEVGAAVQVVMTKGAKEFIAPLSLQALSGQPVRDDLWDARAEAGMGHIELARWPDVILIAPASADCIARLAAGLADDLLTTLCLASDKPLAIAPAMNRLMWRHPATVANCAQLARRGVAIWGPGRGDQACGEVGDGRLLEPLALRERLVAFLSAPQCLAGRRVLLTAGPTRENLDPVRFVTNRSSGKMGFAVAAAAAAAGAKVTLVSGPVALPTPAAVTRLDVESALEMYEAVMATVHECDIFIATAAVADYRAATIAPHKLKKSTQNLILELIPNPDILAAVAALPAKPFTVGFAAETIDVEANAEAKRHRKGVDLMAANRVGPGLGFDTDDNALTLLWEGGRQVLGPSDKGTLGRALIQCLAERLVASAPAGAVTP